MTDARWKEFFNSAVSAGLYEQDLTYKRADSSGVTKR